MPIEPPPEGYTEKQLWEDAKRILQYYRETKSPIGSVIGATAFLTVNWMMEKDESVATLWDQYKYVIMAILVRGGKMSADAAKQVSVDEILEDFIKTATQIPLKDKPEILGFMPTDGELAAVLAASDEEDDDTPEFTDSFVV